MPSEMAHSIQIVKACEAFVSRGIDIELVVPSRFTPIPESPEQYYGIKNTFPIRRLTVPDVVRRFGRFGFKLQVLFFGIASVWYVWKKHPDVVYCRDEHILFFTLLLRARNGIWESHDGAWNRVARYVASRAKRIVVVTEGQRDWYVARGVPKEKIVALPNGIDTSVFAHTESRESARTRLGLPQDAFIALYVGEFGGWKGTDTLFASSELLPEGVRIVTIGSSQKKRDAVAPLYPKVILLPERPYRELQDNLAVADVCVLPNTGKDRISVSFTSPLKLLAYMASGKPIVASDLPSVRELVGEGSAVLVEPDNPQALAEGILRIANDPLLAKHLSQEAQKRAQSFDWRIRAEKILAFIGGDR